MVLHTCAGDRAQLLIDDFMINSVLLFFLPVDIPERERGQEQESSDTSQRKTATAYRYDSEGIYFL